MAKVTINFTHPMGLHLRPSSILSEIANKYNAQSTISFRDKKADLKSILEILSLGCTPGEIVIETVGPDAEQAIIELEAAFTGNFD